MSGNSKSQTTINQHAISGSDNCLLFINNIYESSSIYNQSASTNASQKSDARGLIHSSSAYDADIRDDHLSSSEDHPMAGIHLMEPWSRLHFRNSLSSSDYIDYMSHKKFRVGNYVAWPSEFPKQISTALGKFIAFYFEMDYYYSATPTGERLSYLSNDMPDAVYGSTKINKNTNGDYYYFRLLTNSKLQGYNGSTLQSVDHAAYEHSLSPDPAGSGQLAYQGFQFPHSSFSNKLSSYNLSHSKKYDVADSDEAVNAFVPWWKFKGSHDSSADSDHVFPDQYSKISIRINDESGDYRTVYNLPCPKSVAAQFIAPAWYGILPGDIGTSNFKKSFYDWAESQGVSNIDNYRNSDDDLNSTSSAKYLTNNTPHSVYVDFNDSDLSGSITSIGGESSVIISAPRSLKYSDSTPLAFGNVHQGGNNLWAIQSGFMDKNGSILESFSENQYPDKINTADSEYNYNAPALSTATTVDANWHRNSLQNAVINNGSIHLYTKSFNGLFNETQKIDSPSSKYITFKTSTQYGSLSFKEGLGFGYLTKSNGQHTVVTTAPYLKEKSTGNLFLTNAGLFNNKGCSYLNNLPTATERSMAYVNTTSQNFPSDSTFGAGPGTSYNKPPVYHVDNILNSNRSIKIGSYAEPQYDQEIRYKAVNSLGQEYDIYRNINSSTFTNDYELLIDYYIYKYNENTKKLELFKTFNEFNLDFVYPSEVFVNPDGTIVTFGQSFDEVSVDESGDLPRVDYQIGDESTNSLASYIFNNDASELSALNESIYSYQYSIYGGLNPILFGLSFASNSKKGFSFSKIKDTDFSSSSNLLFDVSYNTASGSICLLTNVNLGSYGNFLRSVFLPISMSSYSITENISTENTLGIGFDGTITTPSGDQLDEVKSHITYAKLFGNVMYVQTSKSSVNPGVGFSDVTGYIFSLGSDSTWVPQESNFPTDFKFGPKRDYSPVFINNRILQVNCPKLPPRVDSSLTGESIITEVNTSDNAYEIPTRSIENKNDFINFNFAFIDYFDFKKYLNSDLQYEHPVNSKQLPSNIKEWKYYRTESPSFVRGFGKHLKNTRKSDELNDYLSENNETSITYLVSSSGVVYYSGSGIIASEGVYSYNTNFAHENDLLSHFSILDDFNTKYNNYKNFKKSKVSSLKIGSSDISKLSTHYPASLLYDSDYSVINNCFFENYHSSYYNSILYVHQYNNDGLTVSSDDLTSAEHYYNSRFDNDPNIDNFYVSKIHSDIKKIVGGIFFVRNDGSVYTPKINYGTHFPPEYQNFPHGCIDTSDPIFEFSYFDSSGGIKDIKKINNGFLFILNNGKVFSLGPPYTALSNMNHTSLNETINLEGNGSFFEVSNENVLYPEIKSYYFNSGIGSTEFDANGSPSNFSASNLLNNINTSDSNSILSLDSNNFQSVVEYTGPRDLDSWVSDGRSYTTDTASTSWNQDQKIGWKNNFDCSNPWNSTQFKDSDFQEIDVKNIYYSSGPSNPSGVMIAITNDNRILLSGGAQLITNNNGDYPNAGGRHYDKSYLPCSYKSLSVPTSIAKSSNSLDFASGQAVNNDSGYYSASDMTAFIDITNSSNHPSFATGTYEDSLIARNPFKYCPFGFDRVDVSSIIDVKISPLFILFYTNDDRIFSLGYPQLLGVENSDMTLMPINAGQSFEYDIYRIDDYLIHPHVKELSLFEITGDSKTLLNNYEDFWVFKGSQFTKDNYKNSVDPSVVAVSPLLEPEAWPTPEQEVFLTFDFDIFIYKKNEDLVLHQCALRKDPKSEKNIRPVTTTVEANTSDLPNSNSGTLRPLYKNALDKVDFQIIKKSTLLNNIKKVFSSSENGFSVSKDKSLYAVTENADVFYINTSLDCSFKDCKSVKDGSLYSEYPNIVPPNLLCSGKSVQLDAFRHSCSNSKSVQSNFYSTSTDLNTDLPALPWSKYIVSHNGFSFQYTSYSDSGILSILHSNDLSAFSFNNASTLTSYSGYLGSSSSSFIFGIPLKLLSSLGNDNLNSWQTSTYNSGTNEYDYFTSRSVFIRYPSDGVVFGFSIPNFETATQSKFVNLNLYNPSTLETSPAYDIYKKSISVDSSNNFTGFVLSEIPAFQQFFLSV